MRRAHEDGHTGVFGVLEMGDRLGIGVSCCCNSVLSMGQFLMYGLSERESTVGQWKYVLTVIS